MKNNYNNLMKDIINENISLGNKPKLFLHFCCVPCLTYPFSLLSEYFDITVYFSNSNIDSEKEFNRRLNELKKLGKIKLLVDSYNHEEYLHIIKGLEGEKEGGKRCIKCFYYRMNKTAEKAKELGFDYFTTVLTVSPYKNAEIINNIGYALEEKYHIKYLPSDFKKEDGYKKGVEMSKKLNLYRQDYCGCEFGKKMEVITLEVGDYLVTNCYILKLDNKCLIIDPGFEGDKIKDRVKGLEILGIIITHYHEDHYSALDHFKEYPLYDYKNIKKENKIGPFEFEALRTPGHKDDAIIIYFPKEKYMFTGDTVFKGSVGRTDLPGGNMEDLFKSLEKIKKYPKDTTIYPGHGDKTRLKDELLYNPYF